MNSRFAEADLASILTHHARTQPGPRHQASESRSLTQGTSAWSALPGTAGTDDQVIDRDDPGGLDGTGGHTDVVVLP